MKRSVNLNEVSLSYIGKYQEQYGCSFNKAVNDLIEKAGSEAGKGKQRTQTMQKQVECIFQWVQQHP